MQRSARGRAGVIASLLQARRREHTRAVGAPMSPDGSHGQQSAIHSNSARWKGAENVCGAVTASSEPPVCWTSHRKEKNRVQRAVHRGQVEKDVMEAD